MNVEYDPWDDITLPPQDTIDIHKNKSESKKDPWDQLDFDEGFWKNAFRTALQIPQGVAEGTKYGIGAGLFQMLALGESDLGIEEWHKLRELSEQEGIPFDEEAYDKARQEMLGMIPTVGNIGSKIETETGLPLEPKEWYQKALRLSSLAGKATPGTIGQKATAATVAPVTSEVLQAAGVPEQFAEIPALIAAGTVGQKGPSIDIGKSKKPSGLTKRQFENIKESREISQNKLNKINKNLESDFKEISDKIIKESPVGETFENLKNDPAFKQESRELLKQAQEVADTIPGTIDSKMIKKEIADMAAKKVKGYALNEYDKSYLKLMKESIDDIIPKNISNGELVQQYRKNNASLSEYFEPGSSKALNRAKRDVLLDNNRAIASIIEKSDPELSNVFKEGNERWTKIMDAEAIDSFIGDVFSEKISYKKMHDFFDKTGFDRIFRRSLGEKGFKDFEQLLKDMLTSETPYKMLKIAKSKGLEDLFNTGLGYMIHPKIGYAKAGLDLVKKTYKELMNMMLDKPQIGLILNRAIVDLKKADFKAAEQGFNAIQGELQEAQKQSKSRPAKTNREETIDTTPKKVEATKKPEQKQIEHKLKVEKEYQKTQEEVVKKNAEIKNKPKKQKKKEVPAKSMTQEKVNEVKRQDISKKGLKEQKQWLLNEVENAIEKSPEIENLKFDKTRQNKYQKGFTKYKEKQESFKDLITFSVPGDGEFKIKNHKTALDTFKEAVEKRWPDKPLRKQPLHK